MVHSEVAGWNTLDFSDITIVLVPLAKATQEELGEGEVEAYVSIRM